MPRVPRLSDNFRETPFPNVRSSSGADIRSFGGGQQSVTDAVSNTIQTGMNIANEMKQRADNAVLRKASSQLSEFEYTFTQEALKRRGEDSFGLPDEFDQKYQDKIAEINQGLSNDDQKREFYIMADDARRKIRRTVDNHVNSQTFEYDKQNTFSAVENERRNATQSLDPDRMKEAIDSQVMFLSKFADDNGYSHDMKENLIAGEISKTHTSIIQAMYSSSPSEALRYFDQYSSEIDPKDLSRDVIQKKIDAEAKAARYQELDNISELEFNGELTERYLDQVKDVIGDKTRKQYSDRIQKSVDREIKDIVRENDPFSGFGPWKKTPEKYINLVKQITDDKVIAYDLKRSLSDAYYDEVLDKDEKKNLKAIYDVMKDINKFGLKESINEISDLINMKGVTDERAALALRRFVKNVNPQDNDESIRNMKDIIITETLIENNPFLKNIGEQKVLGVINGRRVYIKRSGNKFVVEDAQ